MWLAQDYTESIRGRTENAGWPHRSLSYSNYFLQNIPQFIWHVLVHYLTGPQNSPRMQIKTVQKITVKKSETDLND